MGDGRRNRQLAIRHADRASITPTASLSTGRTVRQAAIRTKTKWVRIATCGRGLSFASKASRICPGGHEGVGLIDQELTRGVSGRAILPSIGRGHAKKGSWNITYALLTIHAKKFGILQRKSASGKCYCCLLAAEIPQSIDAAFRMHTIVACAAASDRLRMLCGRSQR